MQLVHSVPGSRVTREWMGSNVAHAIDWLSQKTAEWSALPSSSATAGLANQGASEVTLVSGVWGLGVCSWSALTPAALSDNTGDG